MSFYRVTLRLPSPQHPLLAEAELFVICFAHGVARTETLHIGDVCFHLFFYSAQVEALLLLKGLSLPFSLALDHVPIAKVQERRKQNHREKD